MQYLTIISTTAAFLLITACAGESGATRDSASIVNQPVQTAADTGPVTAQNTSTASSAPSDPATWTVSASGIGPIRIGMTAAEADAALGNQLTTPATAEPCGYASSRKLPRGVRLMVVNGRIARVEVDTGRVATSTGARIGDAESRVLQLYGGNVTTTPHKYVEGAHYLTVTPSAPADSAHRIVFETKGSRVTRYRAGALPAVEWVEGCA